MKPIPDITCIHHEETFNRDALAADEYHFELKQNVYQVEKIWYSVDSYSGERRSGVDTGTLTNYFPEHKLVKIVWDKGFFEYFREDKKCFTNNTDNVFLYFTFPSLNPHKNSHAQLFADLCGYLYSKITGTTVQFDLNIPPVNKDEKQVIQGQSAGNNLVLIRDFHSTNPIMVKGWSQNHPYDIEISIHVYPEQKGSVMAENGYIVVYNLAKEKSRLLEYLREFLKANPLLKDYNE